VKFLGLAVPDDDNEERPCWGTVIEKALCTDRNFAAFSHEMGIAAKYHLSQWKHMNAAFRWLLIRHTHMPAQNRHLYPLFWGISLGG
jgi:hypothetical protein